MLLWKQNRKHPPPSLPLRHGPARRLRPVRVRRYLSKPSPSREQQADQTGEAAAESPQLMALGTRGKHDLSNVRLHHDGQAQRAAQREKARAFTQGQDIYFNQGEFNPSSGAGRALIGHELAHVAQQQAGQAQGIQRKALSDASEAERTKLELPSAPTTIGDDVLKEYFEKMKSGGWGSSRSAPKGVSVELQGIKDEYKTPMTSIAMYMNAQLSYGSTVTGVTKAMFGPGTSITLHLALAKYGLADGNYRFAWTGDEQTGTIYIESMAAGPKDENAPTENNGKIAVGGLNFEAVGTWSSDQMGYLKRALALIPLAALKEVDGLKFKIDGGSGNRGEDGKYDESTHTVIMFSSAFTLSDTRFGDSPKPVQELAHEIGHAIDLAPLNKAWKKYESSGKTSDLTSVASPSGSKWEQDKSKTWQMAERIAKTDGTFRTAATKDGVAKTTTEITDASGTKQKLTHLKGGISDYGSTNWTELYAESFALYTTDPATLKLLRPNLYVYFVGKFPRTTP
ncbi:MAG: DUF4157 domain-containing protein [Caldilineaceae bacterium]